MFIFNQIIYKKEINIIKDIIRIFKVDQTSSRVDKNTTINKVREKSEQVIILVKEISEIFIILENLVNRENLSPFGIFKGIKNGRKEKKLKEKQVDKNNRIYIRKDIFSERLSKLLIRTDLKLIQETRAILIKDRVIVYINGRFI